MEDVLKQLLECTYELEGILLVARSHGGASTGCLRELIVRKAGLVADLAGDLANFQPEDETDDIATSTEAAEDAAATVDDRAFIPERLDIEPVKEPSIPEPEPVDYPEDDEDDGYIDEEEDDDAITVDESLQRTLSRDLHKAFSLNDRFRFRRELFSNNDVEMNDTLNLVETMGSYAEAEEFFYGDLEWDAESPEVADFMNIIKNHFLGCSQQR